MRRRTIIGVLAAVLAILGTVLIVTYVQGADARAMANQELTQVLVVTKDIPLGTAAKDLGGSVESRKLPKAAVVAGSAKALSELTQDNVTSTTLKAGEQVLASRFVPPNSDDLTAQVALPAGMQQLSIELAPERVVGSKLKAGDLVGIYMTMKVKDATDATKPEVDVTGVIAHKVLVLRSQGAVPQTPATPSASDKIPSSTVIVTLAVDTQLAQRIIFGKELAKVWLTQEKDDSTTPVTLPITAGTVYQK
jgi:pilus assembly protein CpaB